MEAGIVNVTRERDIAVISVNNPPVNTITAAVRAALGRALDEVEALSDIKAVVLICEGSTFFSGADIGEFDGPPKEAEFRDLFGRFEALSVPVVAAMHGTVLGGGLEIALACHYRAAVPTARFGFPEVTLGIIPGAGRHAAAAAPDRRRQGARTDPECATGECRCRRGVWICRCVDRGRSSCRRRRLCPHLGVARRGAAPHGRPQGRSGHRDRLDLRRAFEAGAQAVSQSHGAAHRDRGGACFAADAARRGSVVRGRTRQWREGHRRVPLRHPSVLRRAAHANRPQSARDRQAAGR